jgi:NTE family protein
MTKNVGRAGAQRRPRIGLALAGGGPLGATYEIGALCALQESVQGLNLSALDGYVGVSAGAFVAAGLANGMTPHQLCKGFIMGRGNLTDRIDPATFIQPAWDEFAQRLSTLPRLLLRATRRSFSRQHTWLSAAEALGQALPAGLFSNLPLQRQVQRMLSANGRSDDFRQLAHKLVIVATDLDTGQAAPFGQPGWDNVPISQAVAASAALPGLFPPVNIHGRWYVDGALKKTLHASVLLEEGLDLILCLNPLVPFDASQSDRRTPIPPLVEGGLPMVLSQTFRSLIHSRLELGMKGYATSHSGTDILLFEPDHRDSELFAANTFSYSRRQRLAEHAYQRTRADLRSRRSGLSRQLARHGLALNHALLDDPQRTLLPTPPKRTPALGHSMTRLVEVLADLQHEMAHAAR